ISYSRLEVPVVHLHRAYSRARLVGAAWTSPFELICNVRRVPRLDAVCGDRIEATGDRNMLGYAARVATRFRCRVRHSGSIHTTSRSFNLADRDARHCCHGGQAGHTDGVPTNIDRRQGGGLGCSACVQKSKPALHDDLVQRRFVADRPNTLWVTDITEHCTPWILSVVATRAVYACSSKAVNRSAGVSQPRVLRGRVLSCSATAWRSAMLWCDRSVPFGKYCRRRPLVFSLVPRCHGAPGSQKYTRMSVATRNERCSDISAP